MAKENITELPVIVRMFERGAGKEPSFDLEEFIATKFSKRKKQLADFFASTEGTVKIVLICVVNIDEESPLSEAVIGGSDTPTTLAIKACFPEQCASGGIKFVLCKNWGGNPGSAVALNEGFELALQSGYTIAMPWSPELQITGEALAGALRFMRKKRLKIVGFARVNWFLRTQHNVWQNTGALVDLLLWNAVGGYSARCNGNGSTLNLPERPDLGAINIAGMEDFYFMLVALKKFGRSIRWGMYGKENPIPWDTNFSDPARALENEKKLARQYAVMKIWTQEVFPEQSFEDVCGRVFQQYFIR